MALALQLLMSNNISVRTYSPSSLEESVWLLQVFFDRCHVTLTYTLLNTVGFCVSTPNCVHVSSNLEVSSHANEEGQEILSTCPFLSNNTVVKKN